jgi:hypothetical protein
MSYRAIITNEQGHGMGKECKSYADALLFLADAAEDALNSGINPYLAIARVPVGFNAQPIALPSADVNLDVASLLMVPREERKHALDALARVTASYQC